MLSVRPAALSDYPRILEIYASARAFMMRSGNPDQWGSRNPPPERVKADIGSGVCYVLFDETGVHGVFSLLHGSDPTYASIEDGAWPNGEPYVTVHRIAGDGTVHGIFKTAFQFWKTVSDNIRIDTHEANRPMRRLIEEHGFRRCGIIRLADGSPRIAYQYASERNTGGF